MIRAMSPAQLQALSVNAKMFNRLSQFRAKNYSAEFHGQKLQSQQTNPPGCGEKSRRIRSNSVLRIERHQFGWQRRAALVTLPTDDPIDKDSLSLIALID
jgi:hypothetical protein